MPDKAIQLSTVSAQLAGRIPTATRETIAHHMAVINSYYSSLIEGNNTLPHEIRAAQAGELSADLAKRDLQLESVAHIQVQTWLKTEKPDLQTLYHPGFY